MPTAYEQAVEKARKGISALTLKQQKELQDIYTKSTLELNDKLWQQGGTPSEKDLLQALETRKTQLAYKVNNKITDGVKTAAVIGTEPDEILAKQILGQFNTGPMPMFNAIQENVVRDILTGNLYADNKTLSDRVWYDLQTDGKDIQHIIATGLQQQKSAQEIANDLTMYAKPPAKRATTFAQDYPTLAMKAQGYAALRLARTSINHAYQTATIQSSQANPYVDGIKWKSAMQHGRTCKLCIERATEDQYGLGAGIFPKDKVPLDHPNGLCTMIPEIEKDLDEVADELKKWIDGEPNKKLDDWYKKDGWKFGGVKPGKGKPDANGQLTKQVKQLEDELDIINNKKYTNIWKDPVSPSDYNYLSANVAGKKLYFEGKLAKAMTAAEAQKWQSLLDDLDDFVLKGQEYSTKNQLKLTLSQQIKGLAGSNPGDLYTDAKKKAAYRFKTQSAADAALRPKTGETWRKMSPIQKQAAHNYTSGSGKFNRPLRGYENGSWHPMNYKGPGKVSLDAEGAKNMIRDLGKAIDTSTYDFDMHLFRGIDNVDGLSGFLKISSQEIDYDTVEDLRNKLIGKTVKDEAFLSTAAAEGTGFGGHKINIYAPRGTKMLYAEPFSAYGRGAQLNWDGISKQTDFGFEFEVIIQKGSEYRITKIEKVGRLLNIDVEVIQR